MAADPPPARGSAGVATPSVTVRGQAAVRTEPDEAMLWITLTALRDAPGPALADVSERSEALVALLDELGVSAADRSTTGIGVHEEFDHTQRGRRSLGHRAAAHVGVRFTDPEMIGRAVTRATTEVDAQIDGPRWQIARRNPVRLQAAREAAADARRKAGAYAEGVGARLGALLRLAEPDLPELDYEFSRQPVFLRARAASAEPMPIEPGEYEVAAAIDATFALEPGDATLEPGDPG